MFYSQFRSDWDLFVDVTNPAAFGTTIHDIWTYLQPTHIRQEAVFGEGTYAFTDKFNVTVGARWYDYENHVSTSAAGFGSPNASLSWDSSRGRVRWIEHRKAIRVGRQDCGR